MATSSNVLDQARELMEKRLGALTEEQERLERALKELGDKRPRRGRPKGSKGSTRTKALGGAKRSGRRSRGRADQAVQLIEKHPGISASDVAKTMKIKPNYLYRVLSDLEKEGRVKKDGRQYYPAG